MDFSSQKIFGFFNSEYQRLRDSPSRVEFLHHFPKSLPSSKKQRVSETRDRFPTSREQTTPQKRHNEFKFFQIGIMLKLNCNFAKWLYFLKALNGDFSSARLENLWRKPESGFFDRFWVPLPEILVLSSRHRLKIDSFLSFSINSSEHV